MIALDPDEHWVRFRNPGACGMFTPEIERYLDEEGINRGLHYHFHPNGVDTQGRRRFKLVIPRVYAIILRLKWPSRVPSDSLTQVEELLSGS